MAKRKLSDEQAKYARGFLGSLRTVEDRQRAARRIAKSEGIEYKSAMRRLQRYTTTTGTQRRDLLRSPKVGEIIRDLPRGGPDAPVFSGLTVSVRGVIKVSSDKRRRTVRFPLKAKEARRVLEARNAKAAAAVIASIPRFAAFDFPEVESLEVEE